jgi:hypothetical protein
MAKATFKKKKSLYPANWIYFKGERSKVLHMEHSLYGAETWTFRKVYQRYLQRFIECGVGEEWRSVGSIV